MKIHQFCITLILILQLRFKNKTFNKERTLSKVVANMGILFESEINLFN